jgi:hypothetical protein
MAFYPPTACVSRNAAPTLTEASRLQHMVTAELRAESFTQSFSSGKETMLDICWYRGEAGFRLGPYSCFLCARTSAKRSA